MPPMNSTIDEDVTAMQFYCSLSFVSTIGCVLFFIFSSNSWLLIPAIFCLIIALACPVLYIIRYRLKKQDVDVERKYGRWLRILLCLNPKPVDPVEFYHANRSNPDEQGSQAEEEGDKAEKPMMKDSEENRV